MNALKLLSDDFVMKESDTKTFILQLMNDDAPYQIPNDAFVRIIIANETDILISKIIDVLDRAMGIVKVTINEYLGDGLFDCELVVTGENIHETFPEQYFQTFRIMPNLENRPENPLTPTTYQVLISRLDATEAKMANLEDYVQGFITQEELEIALEPKANTADVHTKEELKVETYTEEEVLDMFTAMFN